MKSSSCAACAPDRPGRRPADSAPCAARPRPCRCRARRRRAMRSAGRRLPIVAAAADEEQPDVARHLLRRDHDEPVLPDRLLDFLLVSQRCDVRSISVAVAPSAGSSAHGLPREARIGGRDVPVERGLRRGRARGLCRLVKRGQQQRGRDERSQIVEHGRDYSDCQSFVYGELSGDIGRGHEMRRPRPPHLSRTESGV